MVTLLQESGRLISVSTGWDLPVSKSYEAIHASRLLVKMKVINFIHLITNILTDLLEKSSHSFDGAERRGLL